MKQIKLYQNPDGKTLMINNSNSEHANLLGSAHCWVCEGWREMQFQVKKIQSLQHLEDPVFIHFEFDNWEPGILELTPGSKDTWECY